MKQLNAKKRLPMLLFLNLVIAIAAADLKHSNIPMPMPTQLAWQQAELGVLVSYDLHVFDDKHYNQSKNRITPYPDIDIFNPSQLDTDQWIKTVKEMGARFAILTASHETGFRLWQSDANPYSLKSVKWGNGKRDIVAEFIASCKKYGIKPGVYLGTRWNSRLGVYDFKITERSTITQEAYNEMIEAEVEEICTRYGDLFELWFDGGAYGPKEGGPDVLSIFEKYQPNCLFYHNYQRADARWGGSETGTVSYPCWARMPFVDGYEGHKKESHADGFRLLKVGDPDGKYWCPAMSDAPLRTHEWFWDEGDDHKVKPLNKLVEMYYGSVGRNSTLIVGLTPDNRGLMPDADVKRCRELGEAVKKIFSNQIAQASGKGKILELALPAKSSFDHLVLQEDIQHGERVRRFEVEYFRNEKWTELNTGTCIGHKRIVKFEPVTADRLRLTISDSVAEPIIKMFAVYNSTDPKTQTPQACSFTDRLDYVGIAVEEPGWHIWGCSPIVGPEGKTHLMVTRWPVSAKFDPGWRVASQIAHYVSDCPEGPFTFSEIALTGTGEDTWDRTGVHNSAIHKVGDQYVLLYISNTGLRGHPANQCIGMATSASLYGPWKKVGTDGLILSPSEAPTHWTYKAGNGVNNPAFLRHSDGRFFLYYKSSKARMGLAIADTLEGPYIHQPNPVTNNKTMIEDGYAFVMDGKVRLLTTDNHGILKRGGGLLWTSKDGLSFDPDPTPGFGVMRDHIAAEHWHQPKTHYGRGGKFERPQVLMIDDEPAYLYLPAGTSITGSDGTLSYVFRIK